MIKLNSLGVVNLLLTILAVARFGLCGDVQTEFETKYGKLKGEVADGYKDKKLTILRGVPFAKPLIGDLRWKKPQELDKFPSDPFEVSSLFWTLVGLGAHLMSNRPGPFWNRPETNPFDRSAPLEGHQKCSALHADDVQEDSREVQR